MTIRFAALAGTAFVLAGLVAPAALLAADDTTRLPGVVTLPAPPPPPQAPSAGPAPAQSTQAAPSDQGGQAAASAQGDPPVAFAASPGSVIIKDFDFTPASITVNVGDTVTWRNNGPTGHSATAKDGSFDTDVLGKGQSASHTFSQAGTFAYYCKPHPFMHGTVRVVAASAGGGGGSSPSSPSSSGSSGSSGTASGSSSSSASGTSSGSSASSRPGLPASGGDAGALATLGAILLAAGLLARRRLDRSQA